LDTVYLIILIDKNGLILSHYSVTMFDNMLYLETQKYSSI
jgi:hypothetical protein